MDAAVPDPRTELLLMTVDEYCQLPEREDVIQELHWGQVVHLTRPELKHTRLQYRLVFSQPAKNNHSYFNADKVSRITTNLL